MEIYIITIYFCAYNAFRVSVVGNIEHNDNVINSNEHLPCTV